MVIATALLGGCAHHYSLAASSAPYGFFSGIWHGVIFPLSLIGSLVSWVLSLIGISLFTDIEIVGRPNTGLFFYYIGFFFGVASWGGPGAASS
jgi:hypothetical protein